MLLFADGEVTGPDTHRFALEMRQREIAAEFVARHIRLAESGAATSQLCSWRSRRSGRAHYTPKAKKRSALLRKLKEVLRRYLSQPVDRVVQLINPVLRGWVNYFAVGHSSECFSFIKDWVEKKIRRHMGRSRNRRGFGWKRWSRRWLYEELKLFNGYRVRRASVPKALPV
jgi:hypothetical protein